MLLSTDSAVHNAMKRQQPIPALPSVHTTNAVRALILPALLLGELLLEPQRCGLPG
jgi:hypothetical protein